MIFFLALLLVPPFLPSFAVYSSHLKSIALSSIFLSIFISPQSFPSSHHLAQSFFLSPLFGQRLRREPEEMKSCRTGEICTSVRPYIRPYVPPRPLRWMDGRTDRRTDVRTCVRMYRFSLFYRTSSPPVPSGAAALLT